MKLVNELQSFISVLILNSNTKVVYEVRRAMFLPSPPHSEYSLLVKMPGVEQRN